MFLDSGKKLEYLKKAHAGTRRVCYFFIENTWLSFQPGTLLVSSGGTTLMSFLKDMSTVKKIQSNKKFLHFIWYIFGEIVQNNPLNWAKNKRKTSTCSPFYCKTYVVFHLPRSWNSEWCHTQVDHVPAAKWKWAMSNAGRATAAVSCCCITNTDS